MRWPEKREKKKLHGSATIGRTWEGEPVPEWDGEGGGGEWHGEPTANAVWYERDDGESKQDWEEGDDEEVDTMEEVRMVGEPSA